ncbi:riboflavin biosynthesis protein RibF [Pontibacillus litoralis]|uniref:Riboflavin biosynthesis protein n=1 Tax=Pontibacillus litoralis JSM 072002 TaxID=1385512 RepID=A0A0A5GBA2_9BACI|nr:riboflavin biosynthesis protein RibF [Pontibacillus litoralis]KGX88400.1 riboflavin biosynthesis protein RibF [Pontibacillus litoralis JSM 072002]
MDIIRLTYPHLNVDLTYPESVVAIGSFDGLHKGHMAVIQAAKDIASEQGRASAVMTFDPHPSVVLNKHKPAKMEHITPLDKKIELLEQMGVDRVFLVTFNKELSSLLPQQFVDQFFIGLNIRHVVAGFDFSYGHMGKGNMDTLPFHARGLLNQTIITKVMNNDEKISSTFIRSLLREGKMEKVASLLGRPYAIKGTVIQGDQRGRTIGFPTANMEVEETYITPPVGVYAVQVKVGDAYYEGMANVGYKPTFYQEEKQLSVEVNLFDFKGNLYGEQLEVLWHRYVRNEIKFNGVEALMDQLKKDERQIRDFFQHN